MKIGLFVYLFFLLNNLYFYLHFSLRNDRSLPMSLEFIRVRSYINDRSSDQLEIIGLSDLNVLNNKHLLIIEDIITTGGQVVSSVKSLRELGAIIDSVLCVVDRKDGYKGNLEEADLKIISLFTSDDLEPISKT